MQRALPLLIVACLFEPQTGRAQTAIASAPLPESPPPIRFFKETAPEPSGVFESLESTSWWEPPASNRDIPRFTIGQTFTVNTAGGLALSAGLFGRRGDPLPLFLSQGVSRETLRFASDSIRVPSASRLQWDAKLGVTSPLWNTPGLKIEGTGEIFVPLSNPSTGLPASRAFRLGAGVAF